MSAVLADYTILKATSGGIVTVPLDPVAPRVGISMFKLAQLLTYRLDQEKSLDMYGQQPKVAAWLETVTALRADAHPTVPVALRTHQLHDADGPRLLIDVGDPAVGYFIDVSAGRWVLVDPRDQESEDLYPIDSRPVFERPEIDFAALPLPQRGDVRGEARDWFRAALNLSDRDWHLVWGWLLSVYFTQWDRQGLLFVAPTKVGKTLRASWLLRFIQPGNPYADGIGADFPTSQREWGSLVATNSVLAFDDVEHITEAVHGNLKRVATGVAFKTQTLYKTSGITVTRGKRPMLLTASGTPSGLRDDLRNRLWLIEPTAPPVGERLRAEFERMAPAIFADLLDDLAGALAFYQTAETELARYVSETGNAVRPLEITALFRALDRSQGLAGQGWLSGSVEGGFEAAARDALLESLMEAAEGDRLAFTVRTLLNKPEHVTGGYMTSQALLAGLTDTAMDLFPDINRLDKELWFPNDPSRMGSMLSRKADSLAAAGVYLSRRRLSHGVRAWEWEPIAEDHLLAVVPPAPPHELALNLSAGKVPDLPE